MKLKSIHHIKSSEQRLYGVTVPVVGLTGGIATGKSTVSKILESKGFSIIDADRLVKDVYALPETKEFILKRHPEVIQNGQISFPLLREKVFSDQTTKIDIESFIYQRLPAAFNSALKKLKDPKVIIYDVPLLFEKKLAPFFDLTVLVYAPRNIQRARLMTRDGHQETMADNILNQQMDIEEKKEKAKFIIDNSKTEAELAEEVNQFLRLAFDI